MAAMRSGKTFYSWKSVLLLIAVIIIICAGIFLWVRTTIEPNIEDVSKMKAEILVSRAVNTALAEQFQSEEIADEFFIVKKNENERIEMVQADSVAINILLTRISQMLKKTFSDMEKEPLEVPIGSLFGSKLFSQAGPSAELDIMPLSVISTDFKTEFETQGINQTKYKIYIIIKCRVKVLAPFSSKTFDTSSTVLIAETVILGEVPDSYVEVPEEDILDVT